LPRGGGLPEPPLGGFMRTSMLALALLAPTSALAEDGALLFKTYCSTCHGDSGKGDGIAAAALNPKPRDFTSAELWKRAGADAAAQKAYIIKGDKEGGPAVGLSALMAPFPHLTDAQREAIADYIIASFKPKAAPAK
jgi:mono/diheme cytochrome c family protein